MSTVYTGPDLRLRKELKSREEERREFCLGNQEWDWPQANSISVHQGLKFSLFAVHRTSIEKKIERFHFCAEKFMSQDLN